MNETISQWDAASRQLSTAIRMYFSGGDAVSIHTLVGAAREIYEKSCQKAGVDRMFNHIRETNEGTDKELWEVINGARNFFKHPRESLDDKISFADPDNKAALFIASHDCAMLCGDRQPIEVQVFNIWFMATEFPSDAKDDGHGEAMERLRQIDTMFPGLREASPEEQKHRGRILLAQALREPSLTSIRMGYRIARSEALISWIDRKIDGVAVPDSDRSRLAGGCIDMAMEHHKAIVTLIAARLHGSAMALIRPTFEAYVRGAWLHQSATDADLDKFKTDKLDKSFEVLITDLEKLEAFECGVLLKAKEAAWARMCDFAHTGVEQVIRRNKVASIEPNYDEGELEEALGFADAIGAMCAIEIAHLASNVTLANEIFENIKSNFLNKH